MLEKYSDEELMAEAMRRKLVSKRRVRYVIEGVWGGYTASQSRVVHREYTTNKEFAEKVKNLGCIRFTDNTLLYLNVREMKYRERKERDILGYKELIRNCLKQGVNSVAELRD